MYDIIYIGIYYLGIGSLKYGLVIEKVDIIVLSFLVMD